VSKFDDLYNALVFEAPLKDYIKAAKMQIGADRAGFKTGLLGKAVTGVGNIASKAVGTVGRGLGVQGKSFPGTGALQAGISKTTGAIGGGLQAAANVRRTAQSLDKQRMQGYTAAPQSYLTVSRDQIPAGNYRQNDIVFFNDQNGKKMRGKFGGSAQDAQNKDVAIILDPEYT
jgi:hypothetical protein